MYPERTDSTVRGAPNTSMHSSRSSSGGRVSAARMQRLLASNLLRPIVEKHAKEVIPIDGLAVLVTDYACITLGGTHTQVAIDITASPQLGRGGFSSSLLYALPDEGRCEWVARTGMFVTRATVRLRRDQPPTVCAAYEPYSVGASYEMRLVCIPRLGARVVSATDFVSPATCIDLPPSSVNRTSTLTDLVVNSTATRIETDGHGHVYGATITGDDHHQPRINIRKWDTNQALLHGSDHRVLTIDPVLLTTVLVKQCVSDHDICTNPCTGNIRLVYRVPRVFNVFVDEHADRVWLLFRDAGTSMFCTPMFTVCCLALDAFGSEVLFQHSWDDHNPRADRHGCSEGALAVSTEFHLFAIMFPGDGKVQIYCADSFQLLQELDTKLRGEFTAIANFRFAPLPDNGGPALLFMVESRARRNGPYSFDFHVFSI